MTRMSIKKSISVQFTNIREEQINTTYLVFHLTVMPLQIIHTGNLEVLLYYVMLIDQPS